MYDSNSTLLKTFSIPQMDGYWSNLLIDEKKNEFYIQFIASTEGSLPLLKKIDIQDGSLTDISFQFSGDTSNALTT